MHLLPFATVTSGTGLTIRILLPSDFFLLSCSSSRSLRPREGSRTRRSSRFRSGKDYRFCHGTFASAFPDHCKFRPEQELRRFSSWLKLNEISHAMSSPFYLLSL